MSFEAPNNNEEKSKVEIFEEEIKGLSDNIYRKDIDKKISSIKDQMSQKSAYDDEEYYTLQEKVEELELQKEKGYDGLYVSEKEARLFEIDAKITEDLKETIALLENEMSQKSAYDDEEYYTLEDKIDKLKELRNNEDFPLVESEFEGEIFQKIAEKSKERESLKKETDEIILSLEDEESLYIARKIQFKLFREALLSQTKEEPKETEISETGDNPQELEEKTHNQEGIDEVLGEGKDRYEEIKIDAKKINEISEFLKNMNEATVEQEENLPPEKQSIFKRLKESLKKEDTQKRILIFAIAGSVGIALPFASIALYGGGVLGFGAGASIPILKLVGLGAHSATIGGPIGAISIFKGLEKALKWKFIPEEESQIEDEELEDLVRSVEEIAKKDLSYDF